MCASLKCIIWNGGLPLDTNVFGFSGAGFGNGTSYAFTAGGSHSPNTASQNLVAVCPQSEKCRRSCARMGPCVRIAPSQTSGSSICRAPRERERPQSPGSTSVATHLEVDARGGDRAHERSVAEVRDGLERRERRVACSAVCDAQQRTLDLVHKSSGRERRQEHHKHGRPGCAHPRCTIG